MKKSTLLLLLFLPFSVLKSQSIEGLYDTDFNEMTLQIKDKKVIGTFKYEDGRLEGELKGQTLTGTWTQSNAKGRFIFVFDADFCSFKGLWSYNDADPETVWNGTKTGTLTKKE